MRTSLVRRGGWSLVEMLASIAIIAILAGILFSVFGGAKERSGEAACGQHLRQIWLAVELYRNDNGAGTAEGSLAQMALPSDPATLPVSTSLWNGCQGPRHPASVLHNEYQWLAGVTGSQVEVDEWIPTTRNVHEGTVLLADWRHNATADLQRTHYQAWYRRDRGRRPPEEECGRVGSDPSLVAPASSAVMKNRSRWIIAAMMAMLVALLLFSRTHPYSLSVASDDMLRSVVEGRKIPEGVVVSNGSFGDLSKEQSRVVIEEIVRPSLVGWRIQGLEHREVSIDSGGVEARLVSPEGKVNRVLWGARPSPRGPTFALDQLLRLAWQTSILTTDGSPPEWKLVQEAPLRGLERDHEKLEQLGIKGLEYGRQGPKSWDQMIDWYRRAP